MSNTIRNKRGSSRRKGDEFQDLSALRLVLELYRDGAEFRVYLEYEKTEAIDDIVVFTGQHIRAVQAKYAVDPLSVYVADDFTDEKSRTFFGKYAEGWRKAKTDHPGCNVTVELLSNRSRDSELEQIIGADGRFTAEFIAGKQRKEPKVFRDKLITACAFEGADADNEFEVFLESFHFQLGQRSRNELRGHLEGEVLDHELGISDRSVFLQLMELVEQHAVDLHEPITRAHLDNIFRTAQKRFLLPQVFPVDAEHFVQVPTFGESLQRQIEVTDGGYVVVTGLPGSGKSTSLSEFFDGLESDSRFVVCRYFCFVSPNEDAGRLRLEAEALRVNLLSELHQQFRDDLQRRHDYSKHRFSEVLAELGEFLVSKNRKLVILLDGLDHAERDLLVRDSVLRALPVSLPRGVVIVVGTQELKNWQPLALSEGRDARHVPIPLFTLNETQAYLVQKHSLALDESWIERIHVRSQGLPLYLRYVAEWLRDHEGDPATLAEMPEGGDGDIRKYYERLWSTFDQAGMSHGRHLCAVLTVLKFPVHENEIADFQKAIPTVDLHSALRAVAHLLRKEEKHLSVFHDSFRVFVNNKLDQPTRQSVARDILAKLKGERGSSRWFTHTFRYALDAGDCDYVLAEVNRKFVDFALQHCRPATEILAAICAAAESAARNQDLVSLAKLGSLHFRTKEGLDQFSYSLLAKIQLALGRVDDVLGFCYRSHERRWLVDEHVAEQVMIWCAETGRLALGEKLFRIYLDTHDAPPSASVLGIYSKRPRRVLRWLATSKSQRQMLERIDLFLPGYSPPLADFLESRFCYGPTDDWCRFKKVRRLFPNHLVRHILLRLVAQQRTRHELAEELVDYLANTPKQENLEVAGFASIAGLPVARVRELAGSVILPPREARTRVPSEQMEGDFDKFEWSAIVLGYENDPVALGNVSAHIGNAKTMYSGFLRFLLKSGIFLGQTTYPLSTSKDDYYRLASAALDELTEAGKEDQSDEMDVLRACRPMLPEALFRLTFHVAANHSEKLDLWRDQLLGLRDCEMWTSHWGINETTEDYIFELRIWERLCAVPEMRSRMLPILHSCAQTYTEAKSLKSGSRSEHFLWLAAVAAECGWRTEAEKWRAKGACCSLAYGYRKDATLDYLVDVLELLNEHEPEHAFRRAAAILELVKWMPHATDNAGTKHFKQSVFAVVLKSNHEVSFALIRFFRDNAGRWQMLDCLEQYCVASKNGDAEVLWALKEAFTPHFHERGRHSKQVVRSVQALRDLGQQSDISAHSARKERYIAFIRTNLDPAWWPDDVWKEVVASEKRNRSDVRDAYSSSKSAPQKEFNLDGSPTQRDQVAIKLSASLDSFCQTIEQLRSGSSYLYEPELVNTALVALTTKTSSAESARRLWDVVRESGDSVSAESLKGIAHRLFDFDEAEAGFECLLRAYQDTTKYFSGSDSGRSILKELCARDQARVSRFFVECCEESFLSDHGGFDLPRMVARFFSTTQDVKGLRQVFEDYLAHCEELFAHLPKDEQYAWLREYQVGALDEGNEIVNFLIDLVGEPEIEQGARIVRALAHLARSRPELVCRVTTQRTMNAEPLLRERLGSLLDALALLCPRTLAPNLERLLPLLKETNFRLRFSMIRVIRTVADTQAVDPAVMAAADEAERAYTPIISYPSRRFFHSAPSADFLRLLRRGVLFDLHHRIQAVCELLGFQAGIAYSYIEGALRGQNWTEDEETERLKVDWDGNARDNRVVWIVPRFHTLVSELLQKFVHETLENGRYSAKLLVVVGNVLRTSDPAFIETLPGVKPCDIDALDVTDGAEWVAAIQTIATPTVEVMPSDGWTTVYEERLQSQTDGSHPLFISNVRVRSLLVAPELANQSGVLPGAALWSDTIPVFHPNEHLTLSDARERLIQEARSPGNVAGDFLPLVSSHENGKAFVGFRCLAFLHPLWLNQYGLSFSGCEILRDGRCVARLEEWQEGYEDEVYSRDLLSAGTRLLIRNDWLNRLLIESERALVIHNEENRRWFRDFWKKEPTSESARSSFNYFVPNL